MEFSRELVVDKGFDGIHLNAEPVSDGDEYFITTLQSIRAQLPSDAILSVTAHALYPLEVVTFVRFPKTLYQWSAEYLHIVAENSDQVALMAYDSGLLFPSDYRSWMAYQVRESAEAVEGTGTDLFIGVPASEEWTPSHHITTEYLANALYGLSVGLTQTDGYQNVTGLALYPHWEMSEAEWDLFDTFP